MILGFDLSSKKIAVSFRAGSERQIAMMTSILGKQWDVSNAFAAYYWTVQFIEEHVPEDVVIAFIEEPVVARGNARTTIKQAYIHGAVHAALTSMVDIDVHLVPITTWKKEVVGKGNASKEEVAAFVAVEFRDSNTVIDQDMADSYCIMRYGERVMEKAKMISDGARLI